MRTNIEIDDKLMREALKVTGINTKREVVDTALRELLRLRKQLAVKKLKGRFAWDGDLDAMRLDK